MNQRFSRLKGCSLEEMTVQTQVLEHLGQRRNTQPMTALESARIKATIEMIPKDVVTVLDVGCGDGRVSAPLRGRYRIVGVDYAYHSVKHLGACGMRASSANLPFRDRSFDVVLCCEVLEHLPKEVFQRTLDEMARVARKYILISVPYRENLRVLYTKCMKCSEAFHIWGHLRSFSKSDLRNLFSHFNEDSTQYFGKSHPYFNRAVLYVNQVFGNRWADFADSTMCPKCGNTKFERTGRNVITIVCGLVNLLTSTLVPRPNRNWILQRYSRGD